MALLPEKGVNHVLDIYSLCRPDGTRCDSGSNLGVVRAAEVCLDCGGWCDFGDGDCADFSQAKAKPQPVIHTPKCRRGLW